jgi:hypothetical protein
MERVQECEFKCFDLPVRPVESDHSKDWSAITYMPPRRKDGGICCDELEFPLSSSKINTRFVQDDCINRSFRPRLFGEAVESGKDARRAAYNFQMGLSNILDACRQKKSSDCKQISLKAAEDRLEAASNLDSVQCDVLWYFHP